jgi:DNA-binding transcriptional regulator YiaG
MVDPVYTRLKNRHVAVTNIAAILAEIRAAYPTMTLKELADTIKVKESTIKRWNRENRARRAEADALISAYPIPPLPNSQSSETMDIVSIPVEILTELFVLCDKMKPFFANRRI